MKQYRVIYSDPAMSSRERYKTRPYDMKTAREVADQLGAMGCSDFDFEPEKEAA